MIKTISVISFILIYFISFSQTPIDRLVNWTNVGLKYPIDLSVGSVNIDDYGAISDDGLADDQAILDAISSFSGERGKIMLSQGVYNFNSQIVLTNGIIIEGQGSNVTFLQFDMDSEIDCIVASGSLSPTNYIVEIADKGLGYLILESEILDIVAGDIIKIQMDGETFMESDWALDCMGQFVLVDSIVFDTIYIDGQLRHSYLTEFNPIVKKVNPIKDILIKSVKIERLDATVGQTCNIRFSYAYNCQIRDIESQNCNFSHISLRSSLHCEISGCYFHHAFAYGEGGQGYGTEMSATSGDCLLQNNIYEHLRHSVLLQSGANGNVAAYNYSFDTYWDQSLFPTASAGDLVLHGNYTYCNLFEGNIAQNAVIDDSHGKNGPYNTFFRNRLENYGIVMNFNPATDTCNLIGNEITNTGFLLGNYSISGNGHYEYGNNHTGDCTPTGTTDIAEVSLYRETPPCYFYEEFEWPGIGYPCVLNEFINPARSRFSEGDMTFDTCEIISFFNINQQNEVPVFYPNPTNGKIYLVDNEFESLSVYNLYGELLDCIDIHNSTSQDLNYSSGVYLLKLKGENNEILFRKLIIR